MRNIKQKYKFRVKKFIIMADMYMYNIDVGKIKSKAYMYNTV